MRIQGQQDAVTANMVFLQVNAIIRSTYTNKCMLIEMPFNSGDGNLSESCKMDRKICCSLVSVYSIT